uniref:TSA: Wollemia nobilis Ref_Wollemi_Transcript_1135_1515 transcribed RNA sequence n=1 Tax=Wollemia nobilis TaxID=56998 RepID=A0A0C9S9D8_9CONI
MAVCSSAHYAHIFYRHVRLMPEDGGIKNCNSQLRFAGCGLHVPKGRIGFKCEGKRWRIMCMKAETKEVARSHEAPDSRAVTSKLVLVVGGTGGVGQLVVARLLDRGIRACVLVRDPKKAESLFGKQDATKLQTFVGDTRQPEELSSSVFEGVTHVICCTGTTAFPSRRWDGDNTPEKTDWDGVRNLVAALPSSVKRFVLVSSVGVTKSDKLPWSIMNLFGVLKFKKMGEDFLRRSGIPFTIIRPGRLTDGPYTSYDLNTLLKATSGTRRAVLIGQGDELLGEASRLDVAEACIQALDIECTLGQTYEMNSVEGIGPGTDQQKWEQLFKKANASLKELNL